MKFSWKGLKKTRKWGLVRREIIGIMTVVLVIMYARPIETSETCRRYPVGVVRVEAFSLAPFITPLDGAQRYKEKCSPLFLALVNFNIVFLF